MMEEEKREAEGMKRKVNAGKGGWLQVGWRWMDESSSTSKIPERRGEEMDERGEWKVEERRKRKENEQKRRCEEMRGLKKERKVDKMKNKTHEKEKRGDNR